MPVKMTKELTIMLKTMAQINKQGPVVQSVVSLTSLLRVISLTVLADSIFVCVEVLRPSQPNGVMLSAVSLPNHTFTGQA